MFFFDGFTTYYRVDDIKVIELCCRHTLSKPHLTDVNFHMKSGSIVNYNYYETQELAELAVEEFLKENKLFAWTHG